MQLTHCRHRERGAAGSNAVEFIKRIQVDSDDTIAFPRDQFRVSAVHLPPPKSDAAAGLLKFLEEDDYDKHAAVVKKSRQEAFDADTERREQAAREKDAHATYTLPLVAYEQAVAKIASVS